jgi:hypothetical protein
MLGCIILIIIKWALVLPHSLFILPFTGKFMHEYDLPMYPDYWFDDLRESVKKEKIQKKNNHDNTI